MTEPASGVIRFLEFSLDAANAQLRRGDEVLALRPKTLAVLHYLAARAGRLVTKAELLDAIWADTAVGEWVLSGCIRELRQALGDDSRAPRVIETAHRHGYRFVAEPAQRAVPAVAAEVPAPHGPGRVLASDAPTVIGRGKDLAVLTARLERALRGERQLVLIAGDAGIGKTTLVDAFCADLTDDRVWVARGQCLPQFGESEPYLPVLEALTRLATTEPGASLRASLRRHSPAWLVQMPSLVDPDEAAELQRTLAGTTRERMLREATGLVEVLDRPLLLILEDLHWCDYATLDLVAALARRRDPASLLVVGTYRPADVIVREHPLRAVVQELASGPACQQIWLENLGVAEVERYVGARCPGLDRAGDLARVLYERTDGNPLFLRSVVDALVDRGALVADDGRWSATTDVATIAGDVPGGLAQMIQRQIDQLKPADRTVLEAASVVGRTPSAAAVAAALEADVIETEERLDALARLGPLLRAVDEIAWPDGTQAGGYELTHALYQSVLRDGVPPARRRRMHQRIATRLEAAFADRRSEVAAELGLHWVEAGDVARAVPHIEETARRAVGRGANREAVAILQRLLALLDGLPPSAPRTLDTIRASLALGLSRQSLDGFGHPEVERVYERARALSADTDDVPQLFQALAALTAIHLSRADLPQARADVDRLAELATRIPFPAAAKVSHLLNGMVRYHTGPLAEAKHHLEATIAVETAEGSPVPIDFHSQGLNYLAMVRFHEGRPDEARACIHGATTRASRLGTPFDQAQNATMRCFLSFFLRDLDGLAADAAVAATLGRDHGFPLASGIGKIMQGRVLAARGQHAPGLATLRDGLVEYRAAGQLISLPTQLAILAEALADAGSDAEALALVTEAKALAETTGDQRYLPELWRLEGDLRARRDEAEAATCFGRAIAIAEEHGARWWELRARTSLFGWQRAHRKKVDRDVFARFVAGFTEGADTADLRTARAAVAPDSRR